MPRVVRRIDLLDHWLSLKDKHRASIRQVKVQRKESMFVSRAVPLLETWGALFPHLYLVFGTNVFDHRFILRDRSCMPVFNSSHVTPSSMQENRPTPRRRLRAHVFQVRHRNELIHYRCGGVSSPGSPERVDSLSMDHSSTTTPRKRVFNILWVGNCTGEYFGMGPVCRMQESMRFFLYSPSPALRSTRWFAFIDDDIYIRPFSLLSMLSSLDDQDSTQPQPSVAVIAANDSMGFFFSRRWYDGGFHDCNNSVNNAIFLAQPAFISRAAMTVLATAVDANALTQLQLAWGGTGDAILGVLLFQHGRDIKLLSARKSYVSSTHYSISEEFPENLTSVFEAPEYGGSVFMIHGLRNFRYKPDQSRAVAHAAHLALNLKTFTEPSHRFVAKVLGELQHPYTAAVKRRQREAGEASARYLQLLPAMVGETVYGEIARRNTGAFVHLDFRSGHCSPAHRMHQQQHHHRRRLTSFSSSTTTNPLSASSTQLPIAWTHLPSRWWADANSLISCWTGPHGRWAHSRESSRIVSRTCLVNVRYSEDRCNQTASTEHPPNFYHWVVPAHACRAIFAPWVAHTSHARSNSLTSSQSAAAAAVPSSASTSTSSHHSQHSHQGSAEQLCLMLAGHRLMFVGDSIQQEFYFTFFAAMWGNLDQVHENCNPSQVKVIPCADGKNSFQVVFIRSDHLLANESKIIENADAQHWPWMPTLEELRITILLINIGAHYAPDEALLGHLENAVQTALDKRPDLLVVYRNTPVGHSNYLDLFSSPPLYEAPDWLAEIKRTHLQADYHYEHFERQNNLTRDFLSRRFPNRVLYLDVASSTSLRADSHVDFLHYCIPGPIDHWVRLLFNALRLLDSAVSQTLLAPESAAGSGAKATFSNSTSSPADAKVGGVGVEKGEGGSTARAGAVTGVLPAGFSLDQLKERLGLPQSQSATLPATTSNTASNTATTPVFASASASAAGDPILAQWEDFRNNSRQRCGTWLEDYARNHTAALSALSRFFPKNGSSAELLPLPMTLPRILVSTSGGQGATDRLVGHLTLFYAALLSNRAYLLSSHANHLSFASSFEPNLLSSLYVPSGGFTTAVSGAWQRHESTAGVFHDTASNIAIINTHDGDPFFTHNFDMQWGGVAYPVLFDSSTEASSAKTANNVVAAHTNRGNIYNLIKNRNFTAQLEKTWGIQARYGVHCAFHYLFKPTAAVLALARPLAVKLADPKVALRIGIQIRTGDFTTFWSHVQPDQFKKKSVSVADFRAFFACAELIEKEHNPSGPVKWYLMSDSLDLRVDAQRVYGDKVITDTQHEPFHTGVNKDHGDAVMQQVMADVLTLSICDFFALTSNSGVGKFGAWLSPNRHQNAYIVGDGTCRPYPDEEMALSNQGI